MQNVCIAPEADLRLGRYWELSGGQQQRVALARALVNRPTVLLLDEPLAALDRKLRRDMQIELQNLQHEVGITFVLVTHDQEEALSMSDTICIMRAGRIVQQGTPTALYDAPVSAWVADFVGKSNFLAGTVGAVTVATAEIVAPAGRSAAGWLGVGAALRPGERAVLAVRPELVRLAAAGAGPTRRRAGAEPDLPGRAHRISRAHARSGRSAGPGAARRPRRERASRRATRWRWAGRHGRPCARRRPGGKVAPTRRTKMSRSRNGKPISAPPSSTSSSATAAARSVAAISSA